MFDSLLWLVMTPFQGLSAVIPSSGSVEAEAPLVPPGCFCSVLLTPRKVPIALYVSSRALSGRGKYRISPGTVSAVTLNYDLCVGFTFFILD